MRIDWIMSSGSWRAGLGLCTLLTVGALLGTACGDDSGNNNDNGDASVGPDVQVTCNPGSAWTPGTLAFTEVTNFWGLEGVQGTRISVTDIDGDGWADIIVRNGAGPDDFAPGGARRRWLLRNTGQGAFEDVSQSSGLFAGRQDTDPDFGRPGEVLASGDVDNDGNLDIYVAVAHPDTVDATDETSELMLGNGDGTYSLGPASSDARFVGALTNPAGVTFVDFDRDGNLDLWITHNTISGSAGQDRLLRGDGAGGFTDVTTAAWLDTEPWVSLGPLNEGRAHSNAWSSAACDLNNDGNPELLASSYGRAPNHLWRADRTGGQVVYRNESVASGYAFDHRTDWCTNLNAQCHCADNPGDDECNTCPLSVDYSVCQALWAGFGGMYRWDHTLDREPFRLGGNSGATVCADVDNDGWVDLLTTEIVHHDVGDTSDPAELLFNLGDPLVRFERPGNDVTGLTRVDTLSNWNHGDMTGALFDFDNDGWLDVYIGASDYDDNKGLLFHQDSPRSFTRLEVEDYFLHWRSHGIVVADFDRDGDLDVIVGHSTARCSTAPDECGDTRQVRMFQNLMGAGSNWLQLTLEGDVGTNRAALGARVEVTSGGVTQTRLVDGGHGHFNTQRDLVLHFGLSTTCEAEVTIQWPDAELTTQTFSVVGNARYRVQQGLDPVAAP